MTNQQYTKLELILDMRARYVRTWNHVYLNQNSDTFSIRWSGYQGDPDNNSFFQETVYPIAMINSVIKQQLTKLKRDIPEAEKAILKDVL